MSETVELKSAIEKLEMIMKEADRFETCAMIRDKTGEEFKLMVDIDKFFLEYTQWKRLQLVRISRHRKLNPTKNARF